MNTSKIIVRVDAEHRTAELEIVTPHKSPRNDGLELTLRRLGIRPLKSIEMPTPRYRITRLTLAERDGSGFDATRVMQILSAAQTHHYVYA